MGLFSPREKKSVMEGGEQASIVEEVLFPSIRGGLANITGLVDLGLMTPTMAGRMLAKGENWRTALGRSAGLTTEALGLGAPPENTPEYFAYKAGQVLTPMPVKGMRAAPAATIVPQVGMNIATEALLGALPPEQAAVAMAATLGTGVAGTAYRNKLIGDLTAGKNLPSVSSTMPLTVGQQTGSVPALRTEEMLRTSPKTEQRVAEFDKKQAESFQKRVEGLLPQVKSKDTAVAMKAFDGLNSLYSKLNSQIKNNADVLFGDVYAKAGGANKAMLSSAPIINRIDDIISKYAPTAVSNKENAAVVTHLEKVKQSLMKEDGTPRQLSAFETVEQWSDYSKKSKHGENFIGDTSSKTAEVVASRLANAYEESVNSLATQLKSSNKNEAAKALILAKDTYKKEMTHLGDIKALGVNQLFDVKSASALDGEKIVKTIAGYTPEYRQRMVTLLEAASPDIMDNVRAQFFKDKLTKGADVAGAAEAKPQFDINQVYKNYQRLIKEDPTALDFLFPKKADLDSFKSSMNDAKMQANTQLGKAPSVDNEVTRAVGAGAILGTGKTFGKTATSSIGELVESGKRMLVGQEDLFNHLFKGVDIKSSFANKITAPLATKMATETAQAGIESRAAEPPMDINAALEQYLKENPQAAPVEPTSPVPTGMPEQAPVEPPMQSTMPLPTGTPEEAPMDINAALEQYLKEQGDAKQAPLQLEIRGMNR